MAKEIDMGQPTDGEKYVIFKREDWDHYMARFFDESRVYLTEDVEAVRLLADRAIDDGTVIRRQDVFAPPALAMYAHAIGTALAVVRLDEAGEPTERTKRLQRTADHFHGQAELAYREHADGKRKLPD